MNSQNLEKINLLIPTSQIGKDFIFKYILHTFLEWAIEIDADQCPEETEIIFHSLNFLLKIQNSELVNQAFIYMITNFILSQKFIPQFWLFDEFLTFLRNFETVPNEYLLLFPTILRKYYSVINFDFQRLLRSFVNFINEKRVIFPQKAIEELLLIYKSIICTIEPNSALIFGALYPSMQSDDIKELNCAICQIIIYKLQGCYLEMPNLEPVNMIAAKSQAVAFGFQSCEMNGPEIDLDDVTIQYNFDIVQDFLEPALIQQLDIIVSILLSEREYIQLFFADLMTNLTEFRENKQLSFVITVFYLKLANKLIDGGYTKDITYVHLVKSFIFENEYFTESMKPFRILAYRVIFQQESLIHSLLKEFVFYPAKFEEICEFFAINFCNVQDKIVSSSNICRSLITGFGCFQNTYPTNEKIPVEIEKKGFKCLEILLKNDSILNIMFKDDSFCMMMISYSLQKRFRKFVFGILQNFLINNSITPSLSKSIFNLLSLSKFQLSCESCWTYIIDFLGLMSEISSKNEKFASTISQIVPILLQFLSEESHAEIIKTFILKMLNFMSFLKSNLILSAIDVQQISIAINTAFGNKFDEKLNSSLFNLISFDNRTIMQPNIADLLLRSINDAHQMIENAKKLTKIVELSEKNSIVLHKAEFDIAIIDKLAEVWDDEDIPEEYYEVMMKMFLSIAKIISSPVVVQKFVRFLSPDNGLTISPHIHQAVDILKKMFGYQRQFSSISNNSLQSVFYLPKGCTMIFNSIPANYSNNTILVRAENQKDYIEVFIENQELIYTSNISDFVIRVEIAAISLKYIAISMEGKENGGSEIKFNCDGIISAVDSKFIWNEETKIIFDHEAICSADSVNYALMNLTHIEKLTPYFKNDTNLFFDYYNEIILSNRYTDSVPKYEQNFPSTLISKVGINILTPLFMFPEVRFTNGKNCNGILGMAVDLIQAVLMTNYTAEATFAQSSGFAMINYVLSQIDTKHRNFDLYLKFYNLYNIIKTKELKSQMMTNIILNINMWCNSDESHKIYEHWLNVFVRENMEFVTTIYSFLSFFSAFISVFQYTEESFSKLSRNVLFQILIEISPFCFTFDDLTAVTNFCVQCNNPILSLDIVNMLKRMSLIQNTPFNKFLQDDQLIAVFYNFLQLENCNGKMGAAIFDILVNLPNLQVPLTTMCFSLLSRLPDTCFDMDLFEGFAKFMYINEGILPSCCFVAIKIGQQAALRVVEILQSQKYESNILYWPIFPLSLFKLMNSATLSKLITCFISYIDDWIYIYKCVDLVSDVFSTPDTLYTAFLNSLLDYLESNPVTDEQFENFAFMVIHFIFFRENDVNNIALMCLFQSQIGGIVEDKASLSSYFHVVFSSNAQDRMISVRDYFLYLMKTGRKRTKFGLRFDSNGSWLDEELATRTAMVLMQKITDSSLIGILLIVMMMIGINNDFVSVIMTDLKLPQQMSKIAESLATLISIKINLNFNSENRVSNIINVREVSINEYNVRYQDAFKAYEIIISKFVGINLDTEKIRNILEALWYNSEDEILNILLYASKTNKTVDFLSNYESKYVEQSEANHKMWRQIWGFLTLDRSSPWGNAVPLQRHFMRDSTLCFANCPFKTKPNWEFNDHKIASIARDTSTSNIEKTTPWVKKESWMKYSSSQNATNSIVLYSAKVNIIKVVGNMKATLELHTFDFSIYYEERTNTKTIYYSTIKSVAAQMHLHKKTAIEIILENKHSIFINFDSTESLNQTMRILNSRVKSVIFKPLTDSLNQMTVKWVNGNISNFEYLMYLNYAAGRSFSNPYQYPIMPLLVLDCESETLDLNNTCIFRDLSKPVGALNIKRLNQLKENESEVLNQKFLYENAYICNLQLFGSLIRVEPFTTMHIQMQSGKFDISERIF